VRVAFPDLQTATSALLSAQELCEVLAARLAASLQDVRTTRELLEQALSGVTQQVLEQAP
jgi:hypothetical protein